MKRCVQRLRSWFQTRLQEQVRDHSRRSNACTRFLPLTVAAAITMAGATVPVLAAPPQFSTVTPDKPVRLPDDFGAHDDFHTEWWYATGWLRLPDGKPLGFQVTFFRTATETDSANPSRFAPKQLIIAHAALSDPAGGRLLHGQKVARAGFGLAYARAGNTDVRLDDWTFKRLPDGRYETRIATPEFSLALTLAPTQPPMLQGDAGVSHKGPHPAQASYYYSQPHLAVSGSLVRTGGAAGAKATQGKSQAVTGEAWLDHEWSTSYLDPAASGWDWTGINLDDGGALMAFRIRDRQGGVLWSHANLRDASGRITQFSAEQVQFSALRRWRSPHTDAAYPVATQLRTGELTWQLNPLLDDQELDSRQSTGAVYWEGAVTVTRDGKPAGRGYLELTGYVKPLKL